MYIETRNKQTKQNKNASVRTVLKYNKTIVETEARSRVNNTQLYYRTHGDIYMEVK